MEKDLANAVQALAAAQHSCMQVAADHEASMKSRGEELAALAQAKKVLNDTTGGAEGQTYSLLQVASGSRVTSRADLADAEVVSLIKRLAQQRHAPAFAQLASRITAVGTAGRPFARSRA